MTSYTDLKTQAQSILKAAEKAREKEIPSVIASIRGAMETYGITVEDLQPRKDKRGRPRMVTRRSTATTGSRSPVKPKYRNPKTGDTWTGRGSAPRWLAAEEARGRKRESFLIAGK
jgi:DNA-binding protein H-NS